VETGVRMFQPRFVNETPGLRFPKERWQWFRSSTSADGSPVHQWLLDWSFLLGLILNWLNFCGQPSWTVQIHTELNWLSADWLHVFECVSLSACLSLRGRMRSTAVIRWSLCCSCSAPSVFSTAPRGTKTSCLCWGRWELIWSIINTLAYSTLILMTF